MMLARRAKRSAAVLLLSLGGATALAQAPASAGKRPVDLESVLERPGVDIPQLEWLSDSDRILFTLGHYYEPVKTVILSTTTGKRRDVEGLQLNFGGSAQLSEDATSFAYIKDGWVWKQPLDPAGPARKIAKLDLSLGKAYDDRKVFCLGEEGRAVYFTQRPKRPEPPKRGPDEPTAIDFDPDAEAPLPLEIFRLDVASAKAVKVGTVDADVRALAWDAKRRELHIQAIRAWGYNTRKIWAAILALDPKSGRTRKVLHTDGGNQGLSSNFSPDGRWVACTYDTENVIYDFRNHAVAVDIDTGEQKFLAPALHVGDDLEWTSDSSAVYARGLIRGYNGLYRLGLDGSVRLVESGDRYIDAFALSPDGKKLALLSTDGYGRVEIRVSDADARNARTVLTIDDPPREFAMGDFRVVSWPSFDGLEIGGYEIRPVGFDPSKRYPMLVDVHGGGPGSRLYLMGGVIGSTIERHLWAAMGYVVFVPDYRSAAPYGPGVIEKMRGSSFSVTDVKDLLAGVDFMVAQGYVDPDRIALLGQSAGAHRVNLLLPDSRRFRVAISNEGWANGWIADSTGTSTGNFEWPINEWFFKTTRAENPEPWFAEDPITELHKIETPTLLISGSPDLGGIGGMTNEYIFSMLRRKGVDTKLILFKDEGHGTTRRSNRRYVMKACVDWVEKHLDLRRDAAGALVFESGRVASRAGGDLMKESQTK